MKNAMNKANIGISWKQGTRLTDLDFTDDVALLAETNEQLQDMTTNLEVEAAKVGLRISHSKTRVMRTGTIQSHINIQIGSTAIERVQRFAYLGSELPCENGGTEADVNCRVGKASAVFQKTRPIWSTQTITMQTKNQLFGTIIIPIATYTSETWKFTAKVARKLNAFQQRCLRRILGITYCDHITNEEILQRSGMKRLQNIVTEH